jgi:hypothetical protein
VGGGLIGTGVGGAAGGGRKGGEKERARTGERGRKGAEGKGADEHVIMGIGCGGWRRRRGEAAA